jgi:uncharacterized membrane protein YdjX (TVP38/TMEM64 family)
MVDPTPPPPRPAPEPAAHARAQSALLRFLTEMDARTARALWVTALLLTLAGAILTFGGLFIDVDQGSVAGILRGLRHAWWAPAAVTALFVVLAFIGAPQIALIAATVAVFGPIEGTALSWVSTMISAAVGFYGGRIAGAATLGRLGGDLMRRVAGRVAENGFLAALIIRLVPSGPFILVNMALGASGMRSAPFLAGSGVGIAPKIVLIAFAGHGVSQLFAKETMAALGFLAGAALLWLAIVFIIRPRLRGREEA